MTISPALRRAPRGRALLALAVAASLTGAGRARADGDNKTIAEALFQEGRRLVAEKKLVEACPKFAESQRIDPSPGTLLNLANCYEQLGRVATAWATYKEAASAAQVAGRADNLAAAQKRADALAPKLPKVRIIAPDAPAGLVVERDGAPLQQAVLDVPLPIDPGEHTIAASAPGKVRWSTTITVAKEPSEQIVKVPPLADAPAAPPSGAAAAEPPPPPTKPQPIDAPPPPPPETGWTTQRSVGAGLVGLGLVGVGAGTYFALSAKDKYDESLVGCSPSDQNVCNAIAVDRRNDARKDGSVATVAVGVGLVAAAAGVVLFIRGARPAPSAATATGSRKASVFSTWTPSVGPGTVSLSGAF